MQSISESLRKQREQILSDAGEEMLGRHNSLLEIAVISLYNRLVNRVGPDMEQFRASGAVLAAGAFGRGLVGLNQPVSMLFLRADSSPWRENRLEEITSPLVEAGWVVNAGQGTADELIEKAEKDFSFFLDLLEFRYISGARALTDDLDKTLDAMVERRRDELLSRVYESRLAREARLEDARNWLEPDLDLNPGGLSDIVAIRAASRIASNIRSLDDAIFRGYLIREEVDFLQQAEKMYIRLLSLLRTISNDSTSVLRFDEQEFLAGKLGYPERAGYLPVEGFMQAMFRHFHGVRVISQEFWERLHESRELAKSGDELPSKPIEEGLIERSGKIHIQTGRYSPAPGRLVHLFRLAAERGLGFANVTRQWIYHHRNALDTSSGDPTVKEELLSLLRADTPDLKTFRRFYDQGLLTSLIPELGAVQGLVQHDAFHLYPVQEHHMRTLMELKKLIAGDYAETEPDLTSVAQDVDDPVWLFLAGLLHDIGKSSGRGHAVNGGEMIPAISRRLGLTPEESDRVQFLVAQHLLLMDSASMRDLADEEMLSQCALAVRTPELLDLLVLLSFADMNSTGPKALEKWKDTPVIPLYNSVRHLLEKGEPSPRVISEKIEQIRAQVRHEVEDLMSGDELDAYFSQLAPRYLLSMAPKAIARHLRMVRQLQVREEPFVWEVSELDGTADITLMSWERPGLLSRSAGILTLHDMNIMGAQVFSMNNGVILLSYRLRLPEGERRKAVDWNRITRDMERLLRGKIALDYRIACHATTRPPAKAPLKQLPTRIIIDNDSSAMYSILEVYTYDRVGLLYTISRTLFELQIRIFVAKITTKVDQVADVFYIRTYHGEKVTDPEQIVEIRKALNFWLDDPVHGC